MPDFGRRRCGDWGFGGSGSAGELPSFGMDFYLLAFLDEQGHPDLESGFERGELGDDAAGGVAADAWLRVGDGELDMRRELQPDGISVVLLNLDDDVVDQQLTVVADDVG